MFADMNVLKELPLVTKERGRGEKRDHLVVTTEMTSV